MSHSRFAGRTALVTGGSRGLGLLIAEQLGRRGCRVMLCARDAGELDRARRRLTAAGIEADTVVCDVTDAGAPALLVDAVRERFGGLDVLVNNAGIIQVGPLATLAEEDFRDAWETMFAAPLRLTLAALPDLRRRHGTVVNIASIGGRIPVPHLLPYVAAKFAMTGWSGGLRAELAADGVSVTTVVPGLMRTGSHTAARFFGDTDKEFAWFSFLAALPLVSGSGARAARAIVRGAERRRPEVVFTPAAKLGTRLYALAPATAARVLALVTRALPGPGGTPERDVAGVRAARRKGRVFAGMTFLNERASRLNNEPVR